MLASIAVVFLIVFLFLRVGFVEPFGVPTGSMAPTWYRIYAYRQMW